LCHGVCLNVTRHREGGRGADRPGAEVLEADDAAGVVDGGAVLDGPVHDAAGRQPSLGAGAGGEHGWEGRMAGANGGEDGDHL